MTHRDDCRADGDAGGPRTGLSRTAGGRAVPLGAGARARPGAPRGPVRRLGGQLGIGLLALFLRLWKLGTPHAFEFDETYYAKDAWSLLHFGYARDYVDTTAQRQDPRRPDHRPVEADAPDGRPPRGRQVADRRSARRPSGWTRSAGGSSSAVVGSLMVLVMVRFARRVTGSTLLGCVAGLLLCFDGLQFVLSRLALLDIFVAFFLLCAVHCLVADRDWYRARMAAAACPAQSTTRGWGPVAALLFRPWLLAAGVCWGLACGTKWEAVYPLAAFGLLVWLWCAGARRSFGVRWSLAASRSLADGVPAFVQLVLVGAGRLRRDAGRAG